MTKPSPVLAHLLALAAIAAPTAAQDPRAPKALDMWLGQYLAGKLDLDKERINKSSPGVRFGFVSEERAASIGHVDELESICRAVAELANADAMASLLQVAAVGFRGVGKDGVEMRPQVVRTVGETWVDRIDAHAGLQVLIEAAENEKAQKGASLAKRVAAVRALGRRKDEIFRPQIEAALRSEEPETRLAGAEACADSKLRTTLPALVEILSGEPDELVLIAGFGAMLDIVRQHRDATPEDALRRCADTAVLALGRTTWRADMAAVDLLEVVRSAQSVAPLIEVLGRFDDSVDRGRDDLRSGRLQERAWEVLVSLTAARFPAEAPEQWKSWWEGAKDEFQVAAVKNDPAPGEGRTTTGDFFGIPIRGSRVLFVVDASGSMAEEWRGDSGAGGTTAQKGEQKIDVARRELLKAVDKLTADCTFNVVIFGNGAKPWQRDMVAANEKNKKAFQRLIDDLRADGGTNLWQGLRDGLKLESLVYGSRYGATYDQLFVLSDGLPTLGDIQDPKEILLLIRETNRYSRLRIDTVYIAGDPQMEKRAAEIVGMSGSDFMKKLAEQNGGISIGY